MASLVCSSTSRLTVLSIFTGAMQGLPLPASSLISNSGSCFTSGVTEHLPLLASSLGSS
eukprot:CAMPEP_0168668158 /NCGR_PEP_ID=MMETSP0503-20121227/20439_1 /TAXON_ID=89963 /ORGANISM="Heterocapsa rotundata, Strain SCCAP K-0483" /LENGTH=58 /DNA_ID=CAMNT_0008712373 /DNA_START=24 /DNA_END=197 /DNA_ORIENTATION=+